MDMYETLRRVFVKVRKLALFPAWRMALGGFGGGSYIGPRMALINPKAIRIGRKVWIWGNGRMEAVLRHGKDRYAPAIEIGDGASIEQNFHCTCARSVRIGGGTTITANCGVFDIIHPYEDPRASPKDQPFAVEPVAIGEDCFIGMNSVIMPGTVLGRHCVVGANSVVRGVFPDYSVIAGAPARILRSYDSGTGSWKKTKLQGA